VNDQVLNFPRFFVSSPTPCPYLPGRLERKIYTDLSGPEATALNDALGHVGFRRSQNVAYRPACDGCSACVSVRVRAQQFAPGKTMRRILHQNSDLQVVRRLPIPTEEQYDLLQRYLKSRHAEGGMADMRLSEYVEMVVSSPVNTLVVEYRQPPRRPGDPECDREDDHEGKLVAVALTDIMADGLSMVYSFFDPELPRRSLGTFVVLHHIQITASMGLPYVYLGYWVEGSRKMDYKNKYKPLEYLGAGGWQPLTDAPS
jgi:arginyl-tRNA--protein-N-Asp/Glu arginylyltransferase